jgi:hypothetical protein
MSLPARLHALQEIAEVERIDRAKSSYGCLEMPGGALST